MVYYFEDFTLHLDILRWIIDDMIYNTFGITNVIDPLYAKVYGSMDKKELAFWYFENINLTEKISIDASKNVRSGIAMRSLLPNELL